MSAPENVEPVEPGSRGKVSKIPGWRKNDLIIDLAKGELGLAELGKKYGGVTPQAIHHFRERNQHRIDDVLLNIQSGTLSELSGLWIADKNRRIAMYEHATELLFEQAEGGQLEPADVRGHIKTAFSGLRSVAEELGDLPTRVAVDTSGTTTVTYQVQGANPEDVN